MGEVNDNMWFGIKENFTINQFAPQGLRRTIGMAVIIYDGFMEAINAEKDENFRNVIQILDGDLAWPKCITTILMKFYDNKGSLMRIFWKIRIWTLMHILFVIVVFFVSVKLILWNTREAFLFTSDSFDKAFGGPPCWELLKILFKGLQ